MTATSVVVLAILALSSAGAITSSAAGYTPFPVHHVHVTSQLTRGKVLLVHCQSKDDDLGVHNLTSGGEFKWQFKLNLLGHTLFWCYLAPDRSHHIAYDAFKEEDANYQEYYFHTYWIAKDDGVYLRRVREKVDQRYFGWENGRGLLMNHTRDI